MARVGAMALLIKTSIRPYVSAAAATTRSMSSGTPMSQRTASARPPAASIAATVSWIVPGRPPGSSTTVRAAQTTVAPRPASPIASPLPMPRDAPVTMTTRSVSSISTYLGQDSPARTRLPDDDGRSGSSAAAMVTAARARGRYSLASPGGVQAADQVPLDVEGVRGSRRSLPDDVGAHVRSRRRDRRRAARGVSVPGRGQALVDGHGSVPREPDCDERSGRAH